MTDVRLHVSPGHYYSPLPSPDDIARALTRAASTQRELPGIDLRENQQLDLLGRLAPLARTLDLERGIGARRFTLDNTWFTYADAVFMALVVGSLRPRHIVEVGCGYSSALLLDVVDTFPTDQTKVTFIEPNAQRLRHILRPEDLDGRLLECAAQDVAIDLFTTLGPGDVLAIDSSHVLKAGSDVQHLINEVLPRLKPGVWVHVHDVFYPFEYPAAWLETGVAFNEAYALRALLQSSPTWRIELFTDFLLRFHARWLRAHLPLSLPRPFQTGGIWLSRQPSDAIA